MDLARSRVDLPTISKSMGHVEYWNHESGCRIMILFACRIRATARLPLKRNKETS
jgi:hypothetical protein